MGFERRTFCNFLRKSQKKVGENLETICILQIEDPYLE